MKIAIAASEAHPFSKTGGLADVAGALFRTFPGRGHETFLFVPLYKSTERNFPIRPFSDDPPVMIPLGADAAPCRYHTLEHSFPGGQNPAGTVIFVGNDDFFGRDELYGSGELDYPDNARRFAFFCKAVLGFLITRGIVCDVIHCNDWQTGIIPLLARTNGLYGDFFHSTRMIFTIHNLGYQGLFPASEMDTAGLGWHLFNPEGPEFYGNVSFIKAGIVGADTITTVSRNYAKEIMLAKYGFGLDGILKKRAAFLTGVPNGIDYDEWNPAGDPLIPHHYDAGNREGKRRCKDALLDRIALAGDRSDPVVCFIGRLSQQKGIDLIADAVPELMRTGLKLIVIGRGDDDFQRRLGRLQEQYRDRFHLYIGFDEPLAHLVYAGSDIFLMPSAYEPCGLGQLIAMHYGTIPVARRTGGLADTVSNGDGRIETLLCPEIFPSEPHTGFLFSGYSPEDFLSEIRKSLCIFRRPDIWERLITNAMTRDFSWGRSAQMYEIIYSGGMP